MSGNTFKEIISRYFSRNTLPYWGVLGIDWIIFIISGLVAYTVNNRFLDTDIDFQKLFITVLVYSIIPFIFFLVFRTYIGIIRFSSFIDLQKLGLTMLAATLADYLLSLVLPAGGLIILFNRSDILLTFLIALTAMWALRIFVKRAYEISASKEEKKIKVAIYGVMSGGVALAKSIGNPGSRFSLSAFVSDERDLIRHGLMGKPVLFNDAGLTARLKEKDIRAILVSPLKVKDLRNNEAMVNELLKNQIRIYVVPEALEWNGQSGIAHNQLREIKIEDLLPREEITVDLEAIKDTLRGKAIIVTGAAGSIGSEIARQVAAFNPAALVLIDQAETPLHDVRLEMARDFHGVNVHTILADICDEVTMERIFARFKPEYVFHAAAYKHVPMMEDNPLESIHNNVNGTKIIADLALKYDAAKFVMVSTDKAVNPTNVMGCSKRICEIYVQSLDKAVVNRRVGGKTRFVTTRFGNVLGSNGSVIPIFKEQIRRGGPVTVTHPDIIRFFMLIPEACRLVLEAGCMGNGGEIFVFDMGNPVRIADLAKRMIQLSGAADIEITYTGLRDGEKLYEEVLNDKETTLPTFHPKIKIAKVREYDFHTVSGHITELIKDARKGDDMLTVGQMKMIVPEFRSRHSIYEQLDNNI